VARYIGPVVKISRREGIPLSPKAERYFAKHKDGITPPGQHAHARPGKPSEYAKRLREKQKARHYFGILERQFRRYFKDASHMKGNTGENLLRLLETRLDNVVRRLGFSSTMPGARQLVNHGHVLVNGKRVDIPSFRTEPGDRVSLGEHLRANLGVRKALSEAVSRGLPAWLEWDGGLAEMAKKAEEAGRLEGSPLAGVVKQWPVREEMSLPVNEQFIVELYSK
jgi:small subunit ribosomal protein S4